MSVFFVCLSQRSRQERGGGETNKIRLKITTATCGINYASCKFLRRYFNWPRFFKTTFSRPHSPKSKHSLCALSTKAVHLIPASLSFLSSPGKQVNQIVGPPTPSGSRKQRVEKETLHTPLAGRSWTLVNSHIHGPSTSVGPMWTCHSSGASPQTPAVGGEHTGTISGHKEGLVLHLITAVDLPEELHPCCQRGSLREINFMADLLGPQAPGCWGVKDRIWWLIFVFFRSSFLLATWSPGVHVLKRS